MPTGMTNWTGKLKAINSHQPSVGSVAMIPYVDPKTKDEIGHVAYVERIDGNSITLLEANFSYGNITRRTATGASLAAAASRLGIVGYYRP